MKKKVLDHLVETPDHALEAMLLAAAKNVPGMLKLHSRACKVSTIDDATDYHKPGALCVIVGVIAKEEMPKPPKANLPWAGAYFVVWDDIPGTIAFCVAQKLEAAR